MICGDCRRSQLLRFKHILTYQCNSSCALFISVWIEQHKTTTTQITEPLVK